MSAQIIIALVSALIGLALGQANGYFERRYARRKILNKVLSDLILTRRLLDWMLYYAMTLAEEMPISAQDRGKEIAITLNSRMFALPDITARYNAAVAMLAEHLPLAASDLHAKASIDMLIDHLQDRFASADTPERLDFAVSYGKMLRETYFPVLDFYILSIAATLGRRYRVAVSEGLKLDIASGPLAALARSSIKEMKRHVAANASSPSRPEAMPAE